MNEAKVKFHQLVLASMNGIVWKLALIKDIQKALAGAERKRKCYDKASNGF